MIQTHGTVVKLKPWNICWSASSWKSHASWKILPRLQIGPHDMPNTGKTYYCVGRTQEDLFITEVGFDVMIIFYFYLSLYKNCGAAESDSDLNLLPFPLLDPGPLPLKWRWSQTKSSYPNTSLFLEVRSGSGFPFFVAISVSEL